MKPHHAQFDTPQGMAALNAIDARLRARLHTKADATTHAAAWYEYRQERYVELGLEGLTGPDSCYHFRDAADYIFWAAGTLTNSGGYALHHPKNKHPITAVNVLAKGFGYRYLRALRGLNDALIEADVSPRKLARFDAECQEFIDVFMPQLNAAGMVNAKGQNPQAVFEVIEMFAREMERVCDWLEMTGQYHRAVGIQRTVDDALHKLHTPPADAPPPRRRKKNKYWC
ncbi:MAG: hypothetical protein BWK72_08455 [Rhodoferax ferrireducens]|uniref:Uncharacterized protein n=1 Tax=Rhodoferax ferrireducens TaxID=192843 RepID=A0A1W9KUZ8_9BURK|nr:MAG: hypothetical protein BWK72_08455 [Rhodoferax ferrireducens]